MTGAADVSEYFNMRCTIGSEQKDINTLQDDGVNAVIWARKSSSNVKQKGDQILNAITVGPR